MLLPGIDPSDLTKTRLVITLLNTIFTQFTIRNSYNDVIKTFRGAIAKNFNVIGDGSSNDEVRCYFEFMKFHKNQFFGSNNFYEVGDNLDFWYQNLSAYWIEFLSNFFDRIVLIFQTFEPPISNEDTIVSSSTTKYSESQRNQMDLFGDSFLSLFESIDGASSEVIRDAIENKIISFVQNCNIYKASKLISILVCSMVHCNPSCLNKLLPLLIDKDLIEQTLPREKLSFRLTIIGAACRKAGSQFLFKINICEVLKPFFDASFIENKDKLVRKATVKLIKDCFRGLLGLYIKSQKVCPEISVSNSKQSGILAHPLNTRLLCKQQAEMSFWNEPDKDSVHYAVQHLKPLVEGCMSTISSIVFPTSTENKIGASQLDQLTNNLILLTKSVVALSKFLHFKTLYFASFTNNFLKYHILLPIWIDLKASLLIMTVS